MSEVVFLVTVLTDLTQSRALFWPMTSTIALAGIAFLLTVGSPLPISMALGMTTVSLDMIIAVASPMGAR